MYAENDEIIQMIEEHISELIRLLADDVRAEGALRSTAEDTRGMRKRLSDKRYRHMNQVILKPGVAVENSV